MSEAVEDWVDKSCLPASPPALPGSGLRSTVWDLVNCVTVSQPFTFQLTKATNVSNDKLVYCPYWSSQPHHIQWIIPPGDPGTSAHLPPRLPCPYCGLCGKAWKKVQKMTRSTTCSYSSPFQGWSHHPLTSCRSPPSSRCPRFVSRLLNR